MATPLGARLLGLFGLADNRLQAADAAVEHASVLEDKITARLGRLEEARAKANASALRALRDVDELFDEVAQHKRALAECARVVRKSACQPVTDAAVAQRLLVLVVRRAQGGEVGGGVLADDTRVALEAGRVRRCVVEFGVPGGGPPQDALRAWKGACWVRIASDESWEVRAGASPQRLPSLNTARQWHAAVVVQPSGDVLVVGGRDESGQLDSVECLRRGARAWENHAKIPTARELCGACAVGTTVVVVGGRPAGGPNTSNVVEAVDAATGACSTLPCLPRAVNGCGVACVDGKVVVTGGFDDHSMRLRSAWALDVGGAASSQQPLRWRSLPSMLHGRNAHGAAAGGGCAFVCGGVALNECEMLRVDQPPGRWEALPSLPTKLYQIGCCYGGGSVFVVGGGPGHQQAVLALNVRTKRGWSRVADLSTPRCWAMAVCVDRHVLVLGGLLGVPLRTCEALDF